MANLNIQLLKSLVGYRQRYRAIYQLKGAVKQHVGISNSSLVFFKVAASKSKLGA